ncbi:MAG: ATP-binding cassette domain-containing protein, partial [Burkholderiales bacterium]
MTPNDSVITVRDLSVSFGNRQPVRSVSFTVPRGAVVGIVGRNGAGKTTLLQTMLGLVHPESGVATLLGDPARALTDATKAKLGYVAQSPELFEWLKVRDQLDLYESLYPTWSSSYANTLMKRF